MEATTSQSKSQLSFVYSQLSKDPHTDSAKDRTRAITGAQFREFPELADWISDFMNNQGAMVACDIPQNRFLRRVGAVVLKLTRLMGAQVIVLIKYLVSYGYYASKDDIQKLIRPLLLVADGRNDVPSYVELGEVELAEWRSGKRYRRNLENRAVTETKIEALEVIGLFFSFRFESRLQQFIHDFKVQTTMNLSALPCETRLPVNVIGAY